MTSEAKQSKLTLGTPNIGVVHVKLYVKLELFSLSICKFYYNYNNKNVFWF